MLFAALLAIVEVNDSKIHETTNLIHLPSDYEVYIRLRYARHRSGQHNPDNRMDVMSDPGFTEPRKSISMSCKTV